MRNRVKLRGATDGDKMERYIRNPEFYGSILSNDDVAIVTEQVKIAKLKTPVFIGGSVLDNSKHLMYDFKYRHGRQIFGEDMRIAYIDTDSFIIHHNLSKEELEQRLKEHQQLFDLSNYPVDHPLYSKVNKKVIGKMKNEVAGMEIKEFCGLRPKSYAYTYCSYNTMFVINIFSFFILVHPYHVQSVDHIEVYSLINHACIELSTSTQSTVKCRFQMSLINPR